MVALSRSGSALSGDGGLLDPQLGTLLALDDRTLAVRWQIALGGPALYPVGVAYQGNVPKQVIVTNGNPSAACADLT